jgi:predicted nucleotidyltransferase component of viral defense system
MIAKESLQPEWIHQVSAENRKADKILIEKVIRALLLLEGLVESGLPFIFKGGTAVMRRLGAIRRLSVDVDISCEMAQDRFEATLADTGTRSTPFSEFDGPC